MTEDVTGKLIREHTESGYEDIGRIVHVGRDDGAIFWIPKRRTRPKPKGCTKDTQAKVFYLKAVRRWERSELDRRLSPDELGGPTHSLVDFTVPEEWNYTDDDLRRGWSGSQAGAKHRRNTNGWLEKRNTLAGWVKPIVDEYSNYELLELGQLDDAVRERAKGLGHRDSSKVARAMRLYLFGCGHPNAMLPAWGRCGCAGQMKCPEKKCGRPPRAVARGRSNNKGFVRTDSARKLLVSGWKKYKKKGTSEYRAYLLTCAEHWPGEEEIKDAHGNRYLLALENERPTYGEFRWAGHQENLSATSANMSERVRRLCFRALHGKADDGIVAVGQLGLIDSTSEDQTPVSSVSRLQILPSTWRTIYMEAKSEYILGLHSGFETPSTLTSLLAVLHGASSKVEYCARYGRVITEEQWHSRMCKRIRADNGELKSEIGIKTMNAAEAAAEFVRSYGADLKGPVEASHHKMHRGVDHDAAASTQGRARERGESRREADACRTHFEHMPHVIDFILYHNNEEPVPHLLTVDMRRDGVAPTRRAIYEWLVKKGYVASEPWDLTMLRTRCLPRIRARIHRDGIHLVDPFDERESRPRLIPQLRYCSTWLIKSGLMERGGQRVIECEVLLDPNDLSRCFFEHRGELHEIERRTSDPRANDLSLCEHLEMAAADQDVIDDTQGSLQESEARRVIANRKTNETARAAKRKEQKAASSPQSKPAMNKRENRAEEIARNKRRALGVGEQKPVQSRKKPAVRSRARGARGSSGSMSDLLSHLESQWERS